MSVSILRYLTLPATLLHEVAHVAVASPWADRVAIEWRPRTGGAMAHIDWRDSAPDWAMLAAGVAPFCLGLLAAGLAIAHATSTGVPEPSGPLDWSRWSIVAMWWVVFVVPSRQDLRASTGSGARTDADTGESA
jgi:hypothetical protein